jgi:excisionase family DNA binding protein
MAQRTYGLLSVAEAAQQLDRSRFFIYDEINRGRIAVYQLGDTYAIKQSDLDGYLESRRREALGTKSRKRLEPSTVGAPEGQPARKPRHGLATQKELRT